MTADYSCASCTLHNSMSVHPLVIRDYILFIFWQRPIKYQHRDSQQGWCHPGRWQTLSSQNIKACSHFAIRILETRNQELIIHSPLPELPTSHPCMLVIWCAASSVLGWNFCQGWRDIRGLSNKTTVQRGRKEGEKVPGNLRVSFRLCLFGG